MVKVKEDLTGRTFGRLKVLRQIEDYVSLKGHHEARWLCECSCANKTIVEVIGNALRSNRTKSCGCITVEKGKLNLLFSQQKKSNIYDLSGEYGIGYASNDSKIKFLFDLEDYDKIKDYTWRYGKRTGISTNILNSQDNTYTTIGLQNIITGQTGINFINRDNKDVRKNNLRLASRVQASQSRKKKKDNTSGFTGVFQVKKHSCWEVSFNINKKQIRIKVSGSINDAVRLRLQAEYDIYKEFAPQQHLYEQYGIPDVRLHRYLVQKLTDKGYDVNSILAQD